MKKSRHIPAPKKKPQRPAANTTGWHSVYDSYATAGDAMRAGHGGEPVDWVKRWGFLPRGLDIPSGCSVIPGGASGPPQLRCDGQLVGTFWPETEENGGRYMWRCQTGQMGTASSAVEAVKRLLQRARIDRIATEGRGTPCAVCKGGMPDGSACIRLPEGPVHLRCKGVADGVERAVKAASAWTGAPALSLTDADIVAVAIVEEWIAYLRAAQVGVYGPLIGDDEKTVLRRRSLEIIIANRFRLKLLEAATRESKP